MDEELRCPKCGTTKYRNPSLKLLVNVCGHALCEACVDTLFVTGSGRCPQCNAGLRRHNFRLQLFDDHLVEKEIDVRKKLLKDYNKKGEDFTSLEEYNDYLEEIEELVINLCNDIDVVDTNKRIDSYKKENAKEIIKNRGKLSRDEEEIEELLERERQESIARNQCFVNENKEHIKSKTRLRESLVDDLMSSDLSAEMIMERHAIKRQQNSSNEVIKGSDIVSNAPKTQSKVFSTGISIGKGSNVFDKIVKQSEGQPYVYTPLHFDLNGPQCPVLSSMITKGYLKNVKPATDQDLAGGFLTHYPCQRALQESFCGLYFKI